MAGICPPLKDCLYFRSFCPALTATRGGPAGVAFQAGAVADQGEIAAFTAIFAFIALHSGLLDPGRHIILHATG